jgi:energy-coupling factor transporter ATP-binding protein EcfA2
MRLPKRSVILEHIRCFASRQEVTLRPLTLLVGENSSGKSTLLASIAAVFDRLRFPSNPPFNEPPFQLGTFDTIATYKGGKYGRDTTFSLGYCVSGPIRNGQRRQVATYVNDNGNPALARIEVAEQEDVLTVEVKPSVFAVSLRLGKADPVEFEIDREGKHSMLPMQALDMVVLRSLRERAKAQKGTERLTPAALDRLLWLGAGHPVRCTSIAPIRSRPRRTYDELNDAFTPEGGHIPALLAKLFDVERDTLESRKVAEALNRFGEESGLYKEVRVKRLGSKATDPFQVYVSIAGPQTNLTDVGYGVSQALPVIVQSILQSTGDIVLLQQPEVHLHPRAQAALGTFFVSAAAGTKRTFVIETHSDFLIDRVRQEVAEGTINTKDVVILYFDKRKLETTIHEIEIDSGGNIVGAPDNYRSFFMEEELRTFRMGG